MRIMTHAHPTSTPPAPSAEVIYNDQCPVCSWEIGHYRAYAEAEGLPLAFHDLNAADLARFGLTEDQAARRLYVLSDGALTSGMPAFFVLWSRMPRYRWLGRLLDRPVLRPLSAWAYDRVLAPLIYAWHRRRQARNQRRAQG